MPGDVTVRFFAAAADAAGTKELSVALEEESTPLKAFLNSLPQSVPRSEADSSPSLSRVCGYSSFLINTIQARPDQAVLSPGDTLDILPPFAGG